MIAPIASMATDMVEIDSHIIDGKEGFSAEYFAFMQALMAAGVDPSMLSPQARGQLAHEMWMDPHSPIDQGGLMMAMTRQTHAMLSHLSDEHVRKDLTDRLGRMQHYFGRMSDEEHAEFYGDFKQRSNALAAAFGHISALQITGHSIANAVTALAMAVPNMLGAVSSQFTLSRQHYVENSQRYVEQNSLASIAGNLRAEFGDILAGLNNSAAQVTAEARASVVDTVDRNDPQYWQKRIAAEKAQYRQTPTTAETTATLQPVQNTEGDSWQNFLEHKRIQEAQLAEEEHLS